MNEQEKKQTMLGRDLFNEHISPLRDKYSELKRIQDVMNRDVNLFLDPPPEPPVPPIPDVRHKYFHLDALGLFLDVLEHAYKEEDKTFDRIEDFIRESATYGVSALSYFSWLDDNKAEHKNLKGKIPWEVSGLLSKKCDFTKPNAHYWYLHKRFLNLLKKYNIQPIPQAFMWKYTFYWFENNKNDVNGFFSGAALRHQKWMAWRLCIEQQRLGIKPMIKLVNEPNHRGRCGGLGGGHWIANWHRDLYNYIQHIVPLEELVIDVHASEFAAAQLVWHSGSHAKCTKCGKYEWDNKKEYNRKPLREQHSCSVIGDLERDHKSLEVFINNLHNWQVKYSEDGSRYGNIRPIPDMNWKYGDSEQVYAMLKKAWGDCKKANKKKDFYWGIYPMECLSKKNGVFDDYYDVDTVDWSRFAAADKAHREVFNE